MKISRVGLDLAKSSIAVHAIDVSGRVLMRRALKREALLPWFTESVPAGCLVGMESCAGAHEWGRRLSARGYQVRLMAPKHVKPYVQGQKNDANDAAAICEAVSRPTMRFVPIKSVPQQDAQALHRVRAKWMADRTAKVNQIRGLLAEYGIVVAQQLRHLRAALSGILEDAENGLSQDFRGLLAGLSDDLKAADTRVDELDARVAAHVRQNQTAQRLQTIPGIGPLTASALIASVGNAHAFKNGRHLAAFLGLTPRQHSTGGKARLLGIHKHGDSYLRGLLVHGARAVQRAAVNKTDARSQWLNALGQRRHKNIATVAQANKTARIAWAVMARDQPYRTDLSHPG
jgi:transposase